MKVYLVSGRKCIAKAKTMAARKTLDPFYQQSLSFRENCRGCILQVRSKFIWSLGHCSYTMPLALQVFCAVRATAGDSAG